MEKIVLTKELFSGRTVVDIDFNDYIVEDTHFSETVFTDNDTIVKVTLKGRLPENVRSLTDFFKDCKSLKEVDMSRLDMSDIEAFDYMFSGCSSLQTVKFPEYFALYFVDLTRMFYGCSQIKEIDLSGLGGISAKVNIEEMFVDCTNLEKLNISGFKTACEGMFKGCKSLKELIMYDCDRETIGEVLIDFFISNLYFPEKITVDEEVETVLRKMRGRLCLKKDKDTEEFSDEPLPKVENGLVTYAYGSNSSFQRIFQSMDATEGKEMWMLVGYPVCCRIGDTFAITMEEETGKYAVLKLMTIMCQKINRAIVLVRVEKVGTFRDFVNGAPEGADITSRISHSINKSLIPTMPAGTYYYTSEDGNRQKIAEYQYPIGEGEMRYYCVDY